MPRSKHRKSFLLPHCLSLSTQTMSVTFKPALWPSGKGKVVKINNNNNNNKKREINNNSFVDVICFPLFGVLKAINVTKVNYFSLDVEGNEMDILRTIPFDDVDITVEYFYSLLLRGHCNFRLHILH